MKITWIENKNPDWKLATIEDKDQTYEDVSINRVSKKGEVFPGFDELMPGAEVEGTLWPSPAGKYYLFPPRPKLEKPNFMKKPNFDRIIEKKQQGIAEAQNEKAKNIAAAQDRSAWMWAKTNASTVLANRNGGFADQTNDLIAKEILDLATQIYNGEPTAPF